MSEEIRRKLVKNIDDLDFTYPHDRGGGSWVPTLQTIRSGAGFQRGLPYIAINFLPTSRKLFATISDLIGFKARPDYHNFGYCELELVNVTVYANQQHSNGKVHGHLFAQWAINKIRQNILSRWESILIEGGANLDRRNTPIIRDVSIYEAPIGVKYYAFSVDVLIRTDVSWDYVPEGYDDTGKTAQSANVILNENDIIRVEYS